MAEALDTLLTLGWWALGWLVTICAAATLAVLAAACLAWAICRALRTAARKVDDALSTLTPTTRKDPTP
ncbi:hypothetical protein ABZ733_08305 [Streptomyces longwoodensis]|uniref:hypothetical protein n=1 Tax=Streptomyces longwoodensis TaxID=68231 RepID=UPI0033CB56B3